MCKSVFTWHLKSADFYEICPSGARYKFDAYFAQGRLDIARAIIEGELENSEKLLHIVYACTLCGACDYICGRVKEMNPTRVIEALRTKLVKDGKGPMPEHKRFAESIERNYNPYGEPHAQRLKWLSEQKLSTKKPDVLYFVGCTSAYRRPEIAQATVKVLNAAGIQFEILHPDEWCCGSPLYRTGQIDLAKKMTHHNIEAINKSGADKVITSCAGCYRALKVDYPEIGATRVRPEVVHSVEYIDQLVKDGRLELTKKINLKVTYHDPCHLGRHSYSGIIGTGQFGVYQPPRDLLRRVPGVNLVEMERIKDDAFCCGAGGGVKSAFPDFATWTAAERIEEAKATGADVIASCCPFCKTNLAETAEKKMEKMKVLDVTEIVARTVKI
jgi:Fe-S oxidoreductase